MEKCNEKIVVIESFDQNSSIQNEMLNRNNSKNTQSQMQDDNLIYQQFNDFNIDENIILCWENYSLPLQELVKSMSVYEKNMIEYYR